MRWRALLIREGVWTTDGRLVCAGATTWDPPRPLVGLLGHSAGTIARLWRVGDDVWGEGDQPGGYVPVDASGRPNWLPIPDLDITASRVEGPDHDPRLVITAAVLRSAHMLPAGRTVWPDLPPPLIGP